MTPHLIVSPRSSTDSIALLKAAREAGWDTHRAIRYRPPDEPVQNPVIYGELIFCDVMAETLGVALFDPPDDWLANLPQKYLRRKVEAAFIRDLPRFVERGFFKPANDKVFPASIYEGGGCVPTRHLSPATPVLVSEIVEFEIEVRCYLLGRKLMTAGVYLTADYVLGESELRAFVGAQKWVQYLLDDSEVELPPASTLDVGFIPGQGWAVVEINQAYSSGVYMRGAGLSADPSKILPVLQAASKPLGEVTEEERPYVRTAPDE